MRRLIYPAAAKSDIVDDFFGAKVADPYRWLEDADSPDTRAWIDAENAITFGYLEQLPERARIGDRAAGRKIGGDEIQSACQQACPTEAIVFGNLNDPQSSVSRRHQDARRYDLLHELGTRPRTAYLVRLKNPNPELA